MLRRLVVASVMVLGCLAWTANVAFANGGSSVASAPVVASGQQEFGNTTDATWIDGCGGADYWILSLLSGDQVTIDWETSDMAFTNELRIFPAGTTDFTINNTESVLDDNIGGNDKQQSTFTAGPQGAYPLVFLAEGCDVGGPYDFTAYITHVMSASLPPLPPAFTGTATVGVHDSAGNPLSGAFTVLMQVSANGVPWTTVGTGTPSNGVAVVAYSVPTTLAGRRVQFRAQVSGAGYRTATSPAQSVTLPAAPPPSQTHRGCVVPKLVGRTTQGARTALVHAHCRLGRVHSVRTLRSLRGLVVSQAPHAGAHRPAGAKVRVTVGR
jgi:hypothetical protein